MHSFTARMTLLLTGIIVGSFLTWPILAFAINGRDAVGVCIDSTAGGSRCEWSMNDKGEIDICNRSGCVTCPSAKDECTVAKKGRPRPNVGLPAGSTVTTAAGTFKVTPRAFNGSILKAKPAEVKPGTGELSK
jgi:hypothetical protein